MDVEGRAVPAGGAHAVHRHALDGIRGLVGREVHRLHGAQRIEQQRANEKDNGYG